MTFVTMITGQFISINDYILTKPLCGAVQPPTLLLTGEPRDVNEKVHTNLGHLT